MEVSQGRYLELLQNGTRSNDRLEYMHAVLAPLAVVELFSVAVAFAWMFASRVLSSASICSVDQVSSSASCAAC
jgi:hypothetical protein